MNRFHVLIGLTSLVLASSANAQIVTGSFNIGSDYVSRGTSQTFGKPAAILYAEHDFKDGTYIAGVAANVDFDNKAIVRQYGEDGTFAETDAFIGHRGKLGQFNYDVALLSINYIGAKKTPGYNPGGNWNMVELHGTLSRTLHKTTISVDTGITPDYFSNYGKSVWVQAAVSQAVSSKLAISAAIGHQHFFEASATGFPASLSNYITWNAGATYALTPHLGVDVRYYTNDTKIDLGPCYKPRGVVQFRRSF